MFWLNDSRCSKVPPALTSCSGSAELERDTTGPIVFLANSATDRIPISLQHLGCVTYAEHVCMCCRFYCADCGFIVEYYGLFSVITVKCISAQPPHNHQCPLISDIDPPCWLRCASRPIRVYISSKFYSADCTRLYKVVNTEVRRSAA